MISFIKCSLVDVACVHAGVWKVVGAERMAGLYQWISLPIILMPVART